MGITKCGEVAVGGSRVGTLVGGAAVLVAPADVGCEGGSLAEDVGLMVACGGAGSGLDVGDGVGVGVGLKVGVAVAGKKRAITGGMFSREAGVNRSRSESTAA